MKKCAGERLVRAEKCGIKKERTKHKDRYGQFFSEQQYKKVVGYGVSSYGSCNDACTDGN